MYMEQVDLRYVRGEHTKEIRGYEGLYGVSDKGNVYNLRSGCMVTPSRGAYVTLSKGGEAMTYRVGDLVARSWVRNKWKYKYVVHKDGDIRNNRVDNLEWSEEKEVIRGKSRRDARKVLQIDRLGGLVGKYNSISDASYMSGVDKASISRCCRGSATSAGGYCWRFE